MLMSLSASGMSLTNKLNMYEYHFFGDNNPEKFFVYIEEWRQIGYMGRERMKSSTTGGQSSRAGRDVGCKVDKKDVAKAYEKYADKFTPKPKYFRNSMKAFLVGGSVCAVSMWLENKFIASGIPEKDAATYVVILLIMTAQLLTGLGWFDTIGKHAGAGVIVPITGFANSMVAPALEYKKEGVVLGVGAKLFSLAGPVLVCGITSSVIIGMIYWIIGMMQ